MLFGMQIKKSWVLSGTISLLLGAYMLPVFGGEEKTIDDYIEDARPYLHHSCQSAWEASGENPDEYVAIMNRFVSIAFINHDFDVERIYSAPQADQDELSVLFYDEIGQRCKENPERLLAGVVASIGVRQDSNSVSALIKLLDNADAEAVVFQACYAMRIWEIRDQLPKVKVFIQVDDGTESLLDGAIDEEKIVAENPDFARAIPVHLADLQLLRNGLAEAPATVAPGDGHEAPGAGGDPVCR